MGTLRWSGNQPWLHKATFKRIKFAYRSTCHLFYGETLRWSGNQPRLHRAKLIRIPFAYPSICNFFYGESLRWSGNQPLLYKDKWIPPHPLQWMTKHRTRLYNQIVANNYNNKDNKGEKQQMHRMKREWHSHSWEMSVPRLPFDEFLGKKLYSHMLWISYFLFVYTICPSLFYSTPFMKFHSLIQEINKNVKNKKNKFFTLQIQIQSIAFCIF